MTGMAFVRKRGGSHQLIESYRDDDGYVRQRIIANMGPAPTVKQAIQNYTNIVASRRAEARAIRKRGDAEEIAMCKWSLDEAKRRLAALRKYASMPEDDEDEDEGGHDVTHPNCKTAYILRANLCRTSAVYDGPVDDDVVLAATAAAKAWSQLARRLAKRLRP